VSDDNKCGTCTACCRVYHIPEFDKPAGIWCTHCDVGKGCKIYATRPQRCVDFECFWLQGQKKNLFGPQMRPDKCKVVFAPSTNPYVMTAITMRGYAEAWRTNKHVLALIARIHKAGVSVAIGAPGAPTQLLLGPDGSRKVVAMTEPDKDGMQWSKDQ